jgi:hypothetical protein
MEELLYDIQNKAHLTAINSDDGTNYVSVGNMQVTEDDEVESQILRSIENSFAKVKNALAKYAVGLDDDRSNIQMSKECDLELKLKLPTNYNHATGNLLNTAIHRYIVNSVLSEWFSITNKEEAALYASSAALNLEEMQDVIYKRVRPTRPNNE